MLIKTVIPKVQLLKVVTWTDHEKNCLGKKNNGSTFKTHT